MSLPAMIGILMLMGIVDEEFDPAGRVRAGGASQTRRDPQRDALMDACSKRAQPIVMTTLAMGAGMLPIALKIGADADFRAPMAIAVIGGLITSTCCRCSTCRSCSPTWTTSSSGSPAPANHPETRTA